MNYTLIASVAVAVSLALDLAVFSTALVRRKAFWLSYVIVLAFQLLVNGVLTGVPVVRYDTSRIIGWRIAFAPVEDLLFGFAMVLSTLAIWVWLGRRDAQRVPGAGR